MASQSLPPPPLTCSTPPPIDFGPDDDEDPFPDDDEADEVDEDDLSGELPSFSDEGNYLIIFNLLLLFVIHGLLDIHFQPFLFPTCYPRTHFIT